MFSPPYHPRSNELAERFVDTFKRMLLEKSSSPEKERIANFLFHYRNTIHLTINDFPAMLLQGRKLRSTMDLFLPQFHSDRSHETADSKNNKIKFHFNRHHGVVNRQFCVGDLAYVQTYNGQQKWEQATIVSRKGKVLFTVFLLKLLLQVVRHANQLRRRIDTNNEQCVYIREQTVVNKPCKLSADKYRRFRATAYRYEIPERQSCSEVPLRRSIRNTKPRMRLQIDP